MDILFLAYKEFFASENASDSSISYLPISIFNSRGNYLHHFNTSCLDILDYFAQHCDK